MTTGASTILNPVESVRIGSKSVDVRELAWKDYLRVIKQLTSTILDLFDPNTNKIIFDKDKLVTALSNQEDVVALILSKSTNLTPEEIDSLGAKDLFKILDKVLDLNINDEVISSGKNLAGRMATAFGSRTPLPKP